MTNSHHVDVDTGAGHGTLTSYIIGFILSIVLTIIPYWVVVGHVFDREWIILVIVVAAVFQLLVQLIFFLHLSTKSEGRWNLLTFAFTVIILLILVVGSLWIMWHLNYNMTDH